MDKKFICPHCKKEITQSDLVKTNINHLQEKIDEELQKNIKEKQKEIENQEKRLLEEKKLLEEKTKLREESLNKERKKFEEEYKREFNKRIKEERKIILEQQNAVIKYANKVYEKTMKEKQKTLEDQKKRIRELKIESDETKNNIKAELTKSIEKQFQEQIASLNRQNNRLEDALKKNKNDKMSQEMKGEIGEEAIKKQIQEKFGQNSVKDVEKGALGADLVFEVIEKGYNYGTILIEVKNTKNWSNDWIEKLKKDQIRSNSVKALLISVANPPKETKEVYLKEWSSSVYSCSPIGFLANLTLFRKSIIEMAHLKALEADKGTIKDLLYERVTSLAFKNKIEYINNNFMKMKEEIEKHELDSKRHFNKQKIRIEEMITHVYGIQDYVEVIANDETKAIGTKQNNIEGEE